METIAKEATHVRGALCAVFGACRHWQGQWEKAAECYEQAIIDTPDNPYHHYHLGLCLLDNGEYHKASKSFKQAIKLKPDEPDFYHGRGLCFYYTAPHNLQNYQHANRDFKKAIKLNPDRADYHHDLGRCLFKQGFYRHAEASFRNAVELNPGEALYFARLSETNEHLECWYQAMGYAETAKRLAQKAGDDILAWQMSNQAFEMQARANDPHYKAPWSDHDPDPVLRDDGPGGPQLQPLPA